MDNDGMEPGDPNEGADETTPLNPHQGREEMGMRTRTSTSTTGWRGRNPSEHHKSETVHFQILIHQNSL